MKYPFRYLLWLFIGITFAQSFSACSILRKPAPANTTIPSLSADDILGTLRSIPGILSVDEKETDGPFAKKYELWIEQAIDHKNPTGPVFQQRVLLGHVAFDAPTIVEIQGYQINTEKAGELATLLNANQIRIEHRFFKPSCPDSIPWEKLSIWQAATDQHKVIQKIKKALYPKSKWLSTGISKGGQCTMIHRSIYPDDVVASVAYVAPLNFGREDPRIYEFLKTVGTPRQRAQIFRFQKLCFDRKDGLLKELKILQQKHNYHWNMETSRALDYYILEYSFAFWQWGSVGFEEIPTGIASDKVLLDHLLKVSGLFFFEESGVESLRPFFWAALTEIGMYGYELEPFAEYFKDAEPLLFDFTAPKNTKPVFRDEAMQKVNDFIQTKATNMLFVYGALDTWGATGVVLTNAAMQRNNHVMRLAGGHHDTRIRSFGAEDQKKMYKLLEEWTGKKVLTEEEW